MSDVSAISVDNLTKSYRLYKSPQDRLKETFHPFSKKYHREFHALQGVSFEVKKGECLGIIGKNGSGKSTLLKILTGVLTPTEGTVAVNGRVSALLELGAGFNPELTGRENVFFNGSLLGVGRKELEDRYDSIVSFADIGEFIDQPVKTYSSGMFVRLAFAVAINVDPDILIIDEALSVGDMGFQKKCVERISEFRESGKTILFCSHDMHAVASLAHRSVFLDHGCVKAVGSSSEVIALFTESMVPLTPDGATRKGHPSFQKRDSEIVQILGTSLENVTRKEATEFETGDTLKVKVRYNASEEIIDPNYSILIFRHDKTLVLISKRSFSPALPRLGRLQGIQEFGFIIPNLALYTGNYAVSVAVWDATNTVSYASNTSVMFSFRSKHIVYGPTEQTAIMITELEWN